MRTYDVITIGGATQDIFVRSAALQVRGDRTHSGASGTLALPVGAKVELDDVLLSSGGGATNAAATFVRMGLRTHCIAKVGNDASGAAVLHNLTHHHIPTEGILRAPKARTAFSVILSLPRHGRTILVYRGSGTRLTPRELSLTGVRARWLYLTSLGGNLPALRHLVAVSRRQRMPIALNPGARELAARRALTRLLPHIALLLVNREEAQQLTGRTGTLESLAQFLTRRFGTMVVITDGAQGAVTAVSGSLWRTTASATVRVVERTGAGDAFGSGFLAGLLREEGNVAAALQYATANAEAVIGVIGAKNGLLNGPPRRRTIVRHRVVAP